MKGVKGKLMKRLKSIPKALQVSNSYTYVHSNVSENQLVCNETEQKKKKNNTIISSNAVTYEESDCEDQINVDVDDKENISPFVDYKQTEPNPRQRSRGTILSFRRPDLNSGTLFDPELLAAFQQAVNEYIKSNEAETKQRREKLNEIEAEPLLAFELKCPPGGLDSVILYTTTLRGIRKTFDDCNSIRFLLESFRVVYFERDVSMHMEFRQELRNVLRCRSAVVPPKLFIKGRYIGGAEEVLTLHEQGKLRPLLRGVPLDRSDGPCEGCAGVRFVVCFRCHGSHKLEGQPDDKCPQCNENGLIVCPYCC